MSEITVNEAGRKGGKSTSEKYGSDFYKEIGKMGGEATSKAHGADFYEEIGRKGGQTTKRLVEAGRKAEGE